MLTVGFQHQVPITPLGGFMLRTLVIPAHVQTSHCCCSDSGEPFAWGLDVGVWLHLRMNALAHLLISCSLLSSKSQ